jgi:hypothetical protein
LAPFSLLSTLYCFENPGPPYCLDEKGSLGYNRVASDNLSDLLMVLEINLEEGKCMFCRNEIHGIWWGFERGDLRWEG